MANKKQVSGPTIEDVLSTLTDAQSKAVAIMIAEIRKSGTKFERLRKQTNDALAKFAEPFVKSRDWQGKMHYFFEYDWEEHRLLISTTSVIVGGGFYFVDRVEAVRALAYIGAVDILKYHLGIPAIEVAKHRARIEASVKELNERYGN